MVKVPLFAVGLLALGLPLLSRTFATTVTPEQLTSAMQWRSVGPYVGGVVIAVSGVTKEPNHYFMGSAGGGVWESKDYGQNWRNISDNYFDNGNIGAIAVSPSDPKIIYVGTGNPDIRNTMLTGDGIYKSTDGGKTWTRKGLTSTNIISSIVVDSRDPDIAYAAAMGHVWAPNSERGIYKTTDGGATWKKILYVNDDTGAIDLAMDPNNAKVLYAAMWEAYRRPWTFSSGGPGSGLYKSEDGGATWTNITHRPGLPTGIFGRVGISIAPSDPNVLYAIIQAAYQGQAGGLFRSSNAGQTWALVNNDMELTQRAFYYSQVFVDPKNPDTVYLPQVSGMWVSRDAGKSIKLIHLPHGDAHSLWINPDKPDLMISGNDGGATVSRDGGETWSSIHNQPTGQFYHVNLDDQFPYWIYGAQQDNTPRAGPSAVGSGGIPPVWTAVAGGEESWVVPQPGKPGVTYGQSYFGMFYRENRDTGTVQPVSPWPAFKFGLAASEIKYRFGWLYGPMVFAPNDAGTFLVGGNVLFESNDQGIHWRAISPDLTRDDKSKQQRPGGPISADVVGQETFDTLTSVAVSAVSSAVIWTGSDDGLVHVTRDGGEHWDEVRPPSLPTWATVTCIEPSHVDAGTAFVTASRYRWDDFRPYAYKTTDYGKHWTEIVAGVAGDQYVQSVRQDPNQPNLMFLGTSKTVYMSLDGGSNWLPLGLNLPAVRVQDIAIQPEQHAVVLATFGRSFWVLDNLQFLEQVGGAEVASDALYLFKPQQTWLVKRSSARPTPNSGENLPAGATVFFHLPADYAGQTVHLSFNTADGQPVRSYTLPQVRQEVRGMAGEPENIPEKLHAGMNRFQWNLRYPDAVEIEGIFHSLMSGPVPAGPEVLPGTYEAVLTYGGTTLKQPFVVKLDPRVKATRGQLEARFDLLMQLHAATDSLDYTVNQALHSRSRLNRAVEDGKVSKGRVAKVLAALDKDIESAVNLKIQSLEGDIVYPGRMRSYLANISRNVDSVLAAPTPSQRQVAMSFMEEAQGNVSRLQADTKRAVEMANH